MMEFLILDNIRTAVILWGGLMVVMLMMLGYMAYDRASRQRAYRRSAHLRKVSARNERLMIGVYLVAFVMAMVNILSHGTGMV